MVTGWLAVSMVCLNLQGDVVKLKDDASVAGKILVEKKDQVVLDIGFTALVIPRTEIVSIEKAGSSKGKKTKPLPSKHSLRAKGDLYHTARSKPSIRGVKELTELLGESVVQVKTPGGLGSGFFLNEEGHLITNFHVIESETEISIEVYHQKKNKLERHTYKDIRIIALNKFHDLALLKIEDKDAPSFKPCMIGETDSLSVGDGVFAIGSPLGLERTVTEGILSTKTRLIQGSLYLQTNAEINPGNSGGPLFNMRGEVIGVTNMKMTFGEGLGFAIPVEQVKSFLKHQDAFAYDNGNPSNPYRYLEPPGAAPVLNKADKKRSEK